MVQERPSGPILEEIVDDYDIDQGEGAAGGNRDQMQIGMLEGPHGRMTSGPLLPITGQDAHKNIILVVYVYKGHDERRV